MAEEDAKRFCLNPEFQRHPDGYIVFRIGRSRYDISIDTAKSMLLSLSICIGDIGNEKKKKRE